MRPVIRQIALCLHPSPEFVTPMANGVADYLAGREDWSIYTPVRMSAGLRKSLSQWSGDGLICSVLTEADRRFARELSVPVVNVAGALPDPGVPSVIGDDAAVGDAAASHLRERGFHHAAVLGWHGAHFARSRAEVFERLWREAGGVCHALTPLNELCRVNRSEQLVMLGEQLRELPGPVAIFGVFDGLAHLVIDGCHQARLRVPEDVAVLGVDNSPTICTLSNPPLSSISQHIRRRGRLAAELLDGLLAGASAPTEPLRVPPHGVITRRSTDMVAVADESVRDALRYISNHVADSPDVDAVAEGVAMSRRTLERRFRQAMGRTIYDQIRHVRLERAKTLLTTTERLLTEVAMDSGFRSSSDLSNLFHRHVGMSPSEYRRRFTTR